VVDGNGCREAFKGYPSKAPELDRYLAYIVNCAITGREYVIYGYKGKQVRDQIHSHDVASLFLDFYKSPSAGEVYNLGGGRRNSTSILETIDLLDDMGFKLKYSYRPANRLGDHICYISDLSKIRTHFSQWKLEYDLPAICRKSPGNVLTGNVLKGLANCLKAQPTCNATRIQSLRDGAGS